MSLRVAVKFDITLDRILDVFQRFVHIRTLRMAAGEFGTTDGNSFIVC